MTVLKALVITILVLAAVWVAGVANSLGVRDGPIGECPLVAVGTSQKADTLFLLTGVGLALRIDTVSLRAGHVVRVLDCGH